VCGTVRGNVAALNCVNMVSLANDIFAHSQAVEVIIIRQIISIKIS
jgi:hypothetical protein